MAREVMPEEPDQAYILNGVTTAMTQEDWGAPPYRQIRCPCGWSSKLAERVLDALGSEMRAAQKAEARTHYLTCEQARLTRPFRESIKKASDAIKRLSDPSGWERFHNQADRVSARKEWKLSEAVEEAYQMDLRATEYVFPDGTRWLLTDERRRSTEEIRNIRVLANPPKPPQSGSGVPSLTPNIILSTTCDELARTKYVPTTGWKGSTPEPVTPRQWLSRRVSEVVELGKLGIPKGKTAPACTDSYGTDYARGFITRWTA